MPRAGWVKPRDDQRLSDHVALGVLTRAFPPQLVDAVVAETGRRQQRSRLLPARLVVYYVLAMALFSESSYEEVVRSLVEGLAWQSGWQQRWRVPSKSAIFQARARLGAEPLAALWTSPRERSRCRGGRSTGPLSPGASCSRARRARRSTRTSYNERVWRPALGAAGIAWVPRQTGMHQLRHHYASVLLDAGVSIAALAFYLGHHDPAVTLRVYSHMMPNTEDRARQAVDAAYSRGPHVAQEA